MSEVMRFPRMFRRQRPPNAAAGGEAEINAMLECWRQIAPLNPYAQVRVLNHLREMADERAQMEMVPIEGSHQ